jgi:hypothetical protein
MATPPRPASSIYSDEFQLDDLLRRLSERTSDQEVRTVQALLEEKEALERELETVQRVWALIYDIMVETNDTVGQLSTVVRYALSRMETERKNWLANCTAI